MPAPEFDEQALLTLTREQLLPHLLRLHPDPLTPLRIWSIGSQARDEALLLLLRLVASQRGCAAQVQLTLFATDPDDQAVFQARHLASSYRLETRPSLEPYHSLLTSGREGLSLPASLRKSLIFGPHDLLHAVPFAHLDLIVCALPLERFSEVHQRELLQRLAYGLVPQGLLVLLAPAAVLPDDVLYRRHQAQPVPFYERTDAKSSLPTQTWTPPPLVSAAAPSPEEEGQGMLETLQVSLEEQMVRNQELEAWFQAYRRAEEAELYLAALVSSLEDAILTGR